MPDRLAIFCKSFEEDFLRLSQLLESHVKLCPEVPFVLSVPRAHEPALRALGRQNSTVTVVHDEDYAPPGMESLYGWYQQQVCKLSVYKTGLADAYFSVDSDAYFINSIGPGDFYHDGRKRIVYSRLFTKYLPSNDALQDFLLNPGAVSLPDTGAGTIDGFGDRLAVFHRWLESSGDTAPVERGRWINRLFQAPLGTSFQPGQILHASLLADMQLFFGDFGISTVDLINLVPWEYNWYGAWAAAARRDQVALSTSPIVHFASAADVAHARSRGVTASHLASRFKVIQMAARHFNDTRF